MRSSLSRGVHNGMYKFRWVKEAQVGHKTDDCGTIAVMAADFAPWLCFNRIYGYCCKRVESERGRQILAGFKWKLQFTH